MFRELMPNPAIVTDPRIRRLRGRRQRLRPARLAARCRQPGVPTDGTWHQVRDASSHLAPSPPCRPHAPRQGAASVLAGLSGPQRRKASRPPGIGARANADESSSALSPRSRGGRTSRPDATLRRWPGDRGPTGGVGMASGRRATTGPLNASAAPPGSSSRWVGCSSDAIPVRPPKAAAGKEARSGARLMRADVADQSVAARRQARSSSIARSMS